MAGRQRPASPYGGQVLQDLHGVLRREAWPAGLTVLSGDDLYHLDLAQAAILHHLLGEEDATFALTVHDRGKVDTADIVAQARARGMFARKRVVLVRGAEVLDGDPEPLALYAKDPPRDSHVVVRAPRLDPRRRIHKVLVEFGHHRLFAVDPERHQREIRHDIRGMAQSMGMTLAEEALTVLAAISSGDLNRVAREMEKLREWKAGDRSAVGLSDLRELGAGGGALSGWEVSDALVARDPSGAMVALRTLLGAGEEPLRLLGGLAWRARQMLQGKAAAESGASQSQTIDAARAWVAREAFLRGLQRYRLSELLTFPGALLDADRNLKSRGAERGAFLEWTVFRMVRPSGDAAGRSSHGGRR